MNSVEMKTEESLMSVLSVLQRIPLHKFGSLVEKLDSISARMQIRTAFLYVAVLIWLAFLGLAGMHLAKVIVSVGTAGIGFYVGCMGVDFLIAHVSSFGLLPGFISYPVGLTLAFALYVLAWKHCVAVMYLGFGAAGFLAASLFIGNVWICIGVGVALMLASVFCFVFAFILAISGVAGFGAVAMLGALLPQVKMLQLGHHPAALWIALGVCLVCLTIQCATTPGWRKFGV
jgi:hypothetical protein